MIKLVIAGIAGICLIIVLIKFVHDWPDLWFWIFLNLFFDPGGYTSEYLDGNLIGPLNISDVVIVGIVICLFYSKINWKFIFQDQFLLKFLFFLFLYTVYYYTAYGGIVPYFHNDFNYVTFLIRNRMFTYGFIILISVYAFSLKGLKYFYIVTLFIGAICLTLYFITLLTGIEMIPVLKEARYTGSEMMRISMSSYGIFEMIFPLTLIAYILSGKIKFNLDYKVLLYYSGVIMLLTLLITLTRRTQIDILWTVIIIVGIISYLFRTGKISEMLKLVLPAIVVVLTLYFTFPKYVDYVSTIGEDVFLLLTTGKDSEGQGDQRISGNDEYVTVKEYIRNNLAFGTGYDCLDWTGEHVTSPRGDKYAHARDAAGEVPVYFALFGFGIAGTVLMLPLYVMLLILFFKLIKLLRRTLINYLSDPLTLLFSVYFLLMIAIKFTNRLWAISVDFNGQKFAPAAVLIGLGFALYRKISLNAYRTTDKTIKE